jgi:FkbM family methyltransferase
VKLFKKLSAKLFGPRSQPLPPPLPPVDELVRRYDEETVEVMARVLKPDSNSVDAGAHAGDILQHMVRLAPRGRHFAIEPIPYLAQALRANYPTVTVHECALSDKDGESTFEHVKNNPGYSGLVRRLAIEGEPVFEQIRVKTLRLDSLIPNEVPIAFIKIDVEGGEYHLMRGALATIQKWRPVIVFEAGWPSAGQYGVTPEQLFRLVTGELGLKLSLMKRWLAGTGKPYTEAEFVQNWSSGPDYYFIAYP